MKKVELQCPACLGFIGNKINFTYTEGSDILDCNCSCGTVWSQKMKESEIENEDTHLIQKDKNR